MGKKKYRDRFQPLNQDNQKSRKPAYIPLSVPSHLAGMSREQIVEQIKATGVEAVRKFPELFQELQQMILAVNPYYALSLFSVYGLASFDGQVDPEWTKENAVVQAHVELLQALALQHQQSKFKLMVQYQIDHETLSAINSLVQELTKAFHERRDAERSILTPEEQRYRQLVIERMRDDTQVVRNWGYPSQVTRIVSEIFSPLDDEIEILTGVRIGALIEMFMKIIGVANERFKKHFKLTTYIHRAKSIPAAIKRFQESFPLLTFDPDDFLRFVDEHHLKIHQARHELTLYANARLAEIFYFGLTDFRDAYPREIDSEVLRSLLNRWSLSFGDLRDNNPEYFFLGNPIWERPLISLNEDSYLWPILGLFNSFCLELMESVIQPHSKIHERYKKRRGEYLEDALEELFKKGLPAAKIYRGSKYGEDEKYENDLLILLDSYLLVIEAKSGKVTAPARRGGEVRLQDTIEKLLLEASQQADRFAAYLVENPGKHSFLTQRGVRNEVDTSRVRQVACLNITLASLGTLNTRGSDLQAAGFITPGITLPPAMSLAELEVVFELLEGTCEKLHYIIRREQFEKHALYIGTELDLFAFYLKTGFNVGELEYNNTLLPLYGMSRELTPYLVREQTGLSVKKPRLKKTALWKHLFRWLETKKLPGWVEAGYLLLNVDYNRQLLFTDGFEKVKRKVQRIGHMSRTDNTYLMPGSSPQEDAIVGMAYKGITREERDILMKRAAILARQPDRSNGVLVIGVDVVQDTAPCSLIKYFQGKQRSDQADNSSIQSPLDENSPLAEGEV